jgi:hypothetical protein
MKKLSIIFAILFAAHAVIATPFWSDLQRAFDSEGRTYSEEREDWGFGGFPIGKVAEDLELHIPIETPIALGPVLTRNEFLRQRIAEGLYPRQIDSNSSFRLELMNRSDVGRGVRISQGANYSLVLTGPFPSQKPSPTRRESFELEPLILAAALAAAVGFGAAVLGLVQRAGVDFPAGLTLPLTMLLSAISLGILTSLGAWAQLGLPRQGAALLGLALLLAALVLRIKRGIDLAPWVHRFTGALRRPEIWILVGLFLLLFALVASFPVTLWDGRSIWLFQTKRLYFDGLLTTAAATHPDTQWSHTSYPLLFPAWMAHFTSLCSLYNERMASLGIPVFFAALAWLFWGTLRELAGTLLASSLTIGLFLYAANQVAGAYVDFFVVTLLAIEVLAFLAPGYRALAWVAAMAASLLKLEGLVLSGAIAAGILLLERPVPKPRVWLPPFLVFVPSVVHMLWSRHLGLEGDFDELDLRGVLSDFCPRIEVILLDIPYAISKQPLILDGIVCASIVVGLLVKRRRSSPRPALIVALASVGAVGFAVAAMLLTPRDLEWHVATAFDRLLLHGSMLAVVAAAIFVAPEPGRRS